MQIERRRASTLRVTLSALELGALIAAARWALEGGEGEMTEDARRQLEQVLESYDAATQRISSS